MLTTRPPKPLHTRLLQEHPCEVAAVKEQHGTQIDARFMAGRFISLGVATKMARCSTMKLTDRQMPMTVM
jgi:hypothetical protein